MVRQLKLEQLKLEQLGQEQLWLEGFLVKKTGDACKRCTFAPASLNSRIYAGKWLARNAGGFAGCKLLYLDLAFVLYVSCAQANWWQHDSSMAGESRDDLLSELNSKLDAHAS